MSRDKRNPIWMVLIAMTILAISGSLTGWVIIRPDLKARAEAAQQLAKKQPPRWALNDGSRVSLDDYTVATSYPVEGFLLHRVTVDPGQLFVWSQEELKAGDQVRLITVPQVLGEFRVSDPIFATKLSR